MLRFASIAAISALIAAPALASTPFTATLKTPKEAKERITAYDVVWICEADKCDAVLNRKTATVRVCKKVAKELGQVVSFGAEGSMLDEKDIEACNSATD